MSENNNDNNLTLAKRINFWLVAESNRSFLQASQEFNIDVQEVYNLLSLLPREDALKAS